MEWEGFLKFHNARKNPLPIFTAGEPCIASGFLRFPRFPREILLKKIIFPVGSTLDDALARPVENILHIRKHIHLATASRLIRPLTSVQRLRRGRTKDR